MVDVDGHVVWELRFPAGGSTETTVPSGWPPAVCTVSMSPIPRPARPRLAKGNVRRSGPTISGSHLGCRSPEETSRCDRPVEVRSKLSRRRSGSERMTSPRRDHRDRSPPTSMSAVRPESRQHERSASTICCPVTSGTVTPAGPSLTITVTTPPCSTLAPGGGILAERRLPPPGWGRRWAGLLDVHHEPECLRAATVATSPSMPAT